MAITPVESSTGATILEDVGECSYNTVVFSCLYHSTIKGKAIKDAATRTTKYMEWTITIEGVVTLPTGDETTDNTWVNLREKLKAQRGQLIYKGKGFGPLIVNAPGAPLKDVCWGPRPEIIDFTPLGNSMAANITWVVVVCIPEYPQIIQSTFGPKGLAPILQFNSESSLSYDDEGYSSLEFKGTLEIPLTNNGVADRTVSTTADAYREALLDFDYDRTLFRPTKRVFNLSRDKRTMTWELQLTEIPLMGLPPGITSARGTFTFRPEKQGVGLVKWICSMRATYTVALTEPRRTAWWAFVNLLVARMAQAELGDIRGASLPPTVGVLPAVAAGAAAVPAGTLGGPMAPLYAFLFLHAPTPPPAAGPRKAKAILINLGGDEGLYLDSKHVTFEASWRVITTLNRILLASGIWRSSPAENRRNYAISMKNITGWKSWLRNSYDASTDIIVDMGGPPLPLPSRPVTVP